MAQIQWFPGHMAKTIRQLKEQLNLCDAVIEVTDARFPMSGRNPELVKLTSHKKRLLFLNKDDLADPALTRIWLDHFEEANLPALAGDARKAKSAAALEERLLAMNQELLERARERGRIIRPLKILVAGIPNSGKSTLINTFCGRKTAATSNKPGVTRALSWIKAGSRLLLLDSPGLLWPKLESRHEQIVLGASAAIKDDIMPLEELAGELLLLLCTRYPDVIRQKWEIGLAKDPAHSSAEQGRELLRRLGIRKNLLRQEGAVDFHRSALYCLRSYRDGELGGLSLESPEDLAL